MRVLVAAAAAFIAAGTTIPAPANGVSVCNFVTHVELKPAVSKFPKDGSFRTTSPGAIECTGSITGSGEITFRGDSGPLGQMCAGDVNATGSLHFTLADKGYKGTFTATRIGAAAYFTSDTTAGRFDGVVQFLPDGDQNCVTSNISTATVTAYGVLF